MTFDDLSPVMQDALRDKFLLEQRRDFADMEPEMWKTFLDDSDVRRLWDEYQSNCWESWMQDAWHDEWYDFLSRALQYNTNKSNVMHVVSGSDSPAN